MELRYRMMFLSKLLVSVQAMTYLERGSTGYIPCPLITSERISLEQVDAMYWYFNGFSSPFFLASHWQGRVNVKKGLPEGVYDIDGNYSLILHNVTDSMEGNFNFKLKPIGKMVKVGGVPVSVKVSPETSRPRVVDCRDVDSSSSTCEVSKADAATQTHNLTCIVENAKPAVNITITRLLSEDNPRAELVNNTETRHELRLEPENSTNPDRFEINNTFTTYASISVPLPSDGDVDQYRCEASGVAVGSANNHVTVTIRVTESKGKDITYSGLAKSDDVAWNAGSSLTYTHSVLVLMATIAIAQLTRRAC